MYYMNITLHVLHEMHVKKKHSSLTFWRQISLPTVSHNVLHFSGLAWAFKLLLCKYMETSNNHVRL